MADVVTADQSAGTLVVLAWRRDALFGAVDPGLYAPGHPAPGGDSWRCSSCSIAMEPGDNCILCSTLKVARCPSLTKKMMPCKRWVVAGGLCHQHGSSDG